MEENGIRDRAEADNDPLTRLLEWFYKHEPDEYTPVPLDLLVRYLEGKVTAAERAMVRGACLRSWTLRRELVELAHDLEEPASPIDSMVLPDAPTWEQFLAARARAHARKHARRKARAGDGEASTADSLLELVRHALSPLSLRQFAPVLLRSAGAPPSSLVPTPHPPHHHRSIVNALGITGETTAEEAPTELTITPEEAALRNFTARIRWIGGAFHQAPLHVEGAQAALRMVFIAHGPGAARPMRCVFNIPAGSEDLRLWTVFLPSLQLFSASLVPRPGTTRIMWPVDNAETTCLAMTFALEGGYRAISPDVEVQP